MAVHAGTSPLTQRELIDEYFMEHRVKVLDLAAFLDRLDRAREIDAEDDFRLRSIREALRRARRRRRRPRAARADDLQRPPHRAAGRAGPEERQGRLRPGGLTMEYIDLHAHMVSRTTDDYRAMALSGCVAVTEPAFWAGYDRPGVEAFADYFDRLTDFEPKRAAKYGIDHYTWLCLNPKEAEDRELTRAGARDHPRVPRAAERAGHRRDRPQPRHAQRARRLQGPRRPRDGVRPADPHPHAAPRGQVEGHEGHRRHARRRPADRAAPRDGRPRRGAHGRHDPRQRLLDRPDALPGDQGLARAARST